MGGSGDAGHGAVAAVGQCGDPGGQVMVALAMTMAMRLPGPRVAYVHDPTSEGGHNLNIDRAPVALAQCPCSSFTCRDSLPGRFFLRSFTDT